MDDQISDYRKHLMGLLEKMQADYDKTVLTMSAGGFGVSALIIKDLIGTAHAKNSVLLFLAWFFWAVAIMAALYSYFTSAHAMEEAIERLDADAGIVAGSYDVWTRCLNYISGISFSLGVILFSLFTYLNL